MKNTQISFDEDFLDTIDRIASESNKTRSAIVREAIKFWLRQKEINDFEEKWINALKDAPDDGTDAEIWEDIEQWGDT